jgi:hypothetical protein
VHVRVPAPQTAAWSLSLYPDAGEAGGSFRPSRRTPVVLTPGVPAKDPKRARAEAARRARTKVRRYCAANRLNRLSTLTYAGAGCHDPKQLRTDVAAFFRSLRWHLGVTRLPYVWVPEWHKTDHGLHVHFGVGRYVGQSLIESTWGRGFVSIKRLGDLPVGSTSLHEARKVAGYLSKYVTKNFEEDLGGLHRYEVAQGFQPAVTRFEGRSSAAVLNRACEVMRSAPSTRWSSADVEDWQGPPAVWFAWG